MRTQKWLIVLLLFVGLMLGGWPVSAALDEPDGLRLPDAPTSRVCQLSAAGTSGLDCLQYASEFESCLALTQVFDKFSPEVISLKDSDGSSVCLFHKSKQTPKPHFFRNL